MKQIVRYISQFVRKDFHAGVYVSTLLFVAALVAFNYSVDFEDGILDQYQQNWWSYPLYFLYYAFPYFSVIGLMVLFLKKERKVFNQRFLFKALFGIALIALKAWFFYHTLLKPEQGTWQEQYLFFKLSARFVNVFIYLVGILMFYKFFEIENKNTYGLCTKEVNLRPYFILLLLMIPLLTWASFQPDFLESYPRLSHKYVTENYWQWFAIFEPLYLGEFITLEWFFRGFLVVGMVQLIGHRAVLPMAVLYCVFHFGKPMGEAISSLFGGYILGIIAYNTRSVWGGIIVHMGIALLMDVLAIISSSFFV